MKKIIVFLLTFFICLPVFSQSLLFSLIESGVESSQQKKKEKNLQLFENFCLMIYRFDEEWLDLYHNNIANI